MKIQFLIWGSLIACLIMVSPKVWAEDTAQLKTQVQTLQNRVDQLQAELASRQAAAAQTISPTYDQWADPFAQMMQMREQMDHTMQQAFADTGVATPKMNIDKTDKQYVITMDIPGMEKSKINVEIKNGMLIVSGERRSEIKNNSNNQNNQYYQQESSFGTFMQAVPLAEDAKADQVEAKYKDGVLTVTVGRIEKEMKRSESKKIKVN